MRPVARCVGTTVAGSVFILALTAAAGAAMLEGERLEAFGRALAWTGGVLVPVAAGVSWAYVRSVVDDLRCVARGVDEMVRDESWGRPVPLRSLDEVGEVTLRFDELRRHYLESLERERDARRRAEEADRDKTEFLTSVSHELRNPLNAVVGFTDVLLAEIDGPLNDGQREDLSIIRGAGAQLVGLFTDVLDLSAAASGHLRLEREPVAIGPLLEAVGAELRGQRRDRPVEIEVDVPGDLPEVHADPRRLRQVVTNLGSNALKFTEEGDVILEARATDGGVSIHVKDTGAGIAPEEIPDLFAEFGQVGRWERRAKGTGLGLAISKQLVELHGGSVTVESTPGVGSTFSVHLPVQGGSR